MSFFLLYGRASVNVEVAANSFEFRDKWSGSSSDSQVAWLRGPTPSQGGVIEKRKI